MIHKLWPVTNSIVAIPNESRSTLSKGCLTVLVALNESFWIGRISIVSIWLALAKRLVDIFSVKAFSQIILGCFSSSIGMWVSFDAFLEFR